MAETLATETHPEQQAVEPHPPGDPMTRRHWRLLADRYSARERLVPPLSQEELLFHAEQLMRTHALSHGQRAFIALLLSNAVWQAVLAGIPFERRLLLLPLCLSNRVVCRGERDEIGLICAHCGGCDLDLIVQEAQRLGYVSLIAEGATVARMLLRDGRIDAVIGVGCMDTLEKLFPDLARHAIPGLAVPLLTTGCQATTLDRDWLLEMIRMRRDDASSRLPDLEQLRALVQDWLAPNQIGGRLEDPVAPVERIAWDWVAAGGKRWRPLLTVAVYAVLTGRESVDAARLTALAVECLHKASLIHDDIEDGDALRDGRPALHAAHGVPIAINAGDFLIGEGYRLLTQLALDDATRFRMLKTVAEGHRTLCLGQGDELARTSDAPPMTLKAYTRLCERKTSAAFEVAILLGAIQGGADEATCEALRRFSRSVGVAYQIRDDLADAERPQGGDLHAHRPSVLLALLQENDSGALVAARDACGVNSGHDPDAERNLIRTLREAGVFERAGQLAEFHLHAAERALAGLHHSGLKRLLRRIAARLIESVSLPSDSTLPQNG